VDRREFLRQSLGYATLGALSPLITSFAQTPGVSVDSPNILLIVSDDQPFHTQDGMSKTNAALSPGVTFTDAHVASPLCSPSRVSMLTGTYVHNHVVRANGGAASAFRKRGYGGARGGRYAEIGYHLSQAGYDCGYFGKLLNDYPHIPAWVPPAYRKQDRSPVAKWVSTVRVGADRIKVNVDGQVRLARSGGTLVPKKNETLFFGERALEFITADHGGAPWFCIASVSAPHSPYIPSDANRGSYATTPMPLRPNFNHFDENKPKDVRGEPERSFDAMQTQWRGKMEELMDLDDVVASLTSAVGFEDTYVFYLTDNGFMLGEHRCAFKAQPYTEATKTPLMVRGPGVRENANSDLLVSGTDIAPTVLDLAGYDSDTFSLDGRSLLGPLMAVPGEEEEEGALETWEWRDYLLIEQLWKEGGKHWQAVRTKDSLYVERDTGERELYDLAADPYQLTNIEPEADRQAIYELHMRLEGLRGASGEDLRSAEVS
jgi:N-acetylglucosamine-6-sulfatase